MPNRVVHELSAVPASSPHVFFSPAAFSAESWGTSGEALTRSNGGVGPDSEEARHSGVGVPELAMPSKTDGGNREGWRSPAMVSRHFVKRVVDLEKLQGHWFFEMSCLMLSSKRCQ